MVSITVTLSFDVIIDLYLNRLSKQSRRRWFETLFYSYDVTVMLGSNVWWQKISHWVEYYKCRHGIKKIIHHWPSVLGFYWVPVDSPHRESVVWSCDVSSLFSWRRCCTNSRMLVNSNAMALIWCHYGVWFVTPLCIAGIPNLMNLQKSF